MFERNKIYNVDTYKAIKEIPDKSIDLIYTDIPYLYNEVKKEIRGSKLAQQIVKTKYSDLSEIRNGIDYDLLNEFVRIQPYIYIYIFGAVNYKY